MKLNIDLSLTKQQINCLINDIVKTIIAMLTLHLFGKNKGLFNDKFIAQVIFMIMGLIISTFVMVKVFNRSNCGCECEKN